MKTCFELYRKRLENVPKRTKKKKRKLAIYEKKINLFIYVISMLRTKLERKRSQDLKKNGNDM